MLRNLNRMLFSVGGSLCFTILSLSAGEIASLPLLPAADMTRAELHYLKATPHPDAVLVLCPGCNGNGLEMLQQQAWQDFAIQHNLGLAGISFASPVELLSQCQGYYQASRDSGDILLDGIRKAFERDLPVLLYGFSGGAHFTTRFIAWKPDRVMGWAALGAGVLDPPAASPCSPPGIMACGENDSRLGGALIFFKQGRAAGKPWLWVEIPGTGHAITPQFENFVRSYFAALLLHKSDPGGWVDVDLAKRISEGEAEKSPSLSGWLPDSDLFATWKKFHRD